MTFLWGIALVAAAAWPGRALGAFDGAPFDTPLEALALGLVLPALWWWYPAFLKTAAARTLVALMLVAKLAAWALLPQGGWCGQFLMANPPQTGGWQLVRSWDARTIGDARMPTCSAIVSRGYARPTHFPAWFINIPYGRDFELKTGRFSNLDEENSRPPSGEYVVNVTGTMETSRAGTLSILTGTDVTVTGDVDAQPVSARRGETPAIRLEAGVHRIDLHLDLSGRNWRFVPLWNDADVFSASVTATRTVTRVERIALGVGGWAVTMLAAGLLGGWLLAAVAAYRPGAPVLAFTATVALCVAWAASGGVDSMLARLAVVPLAACMFAPVPSRLRDARGAWLLVGVPWLALIAALALRDVGRFTLYLFGDDALTYQRFAYRIFMQGFWLEGGQATFWNQPLYRWICGALHLLFGDSRAGEILWDGFALLVGAMFAFHIVNGLTGFRFGLVAAVCVLLTMALGPNWYMIGRGLGEISASLWVYLTALSLLASRRGSVAAAALAGLFASFAFYTRLNHLPLVLALVTLTLADSVPAGSAFDVRLLWARLPKRVVTAYLLCLAAGLSAFAARTWYYTGELSLFAGTTRVHNSTGLGLTLDSLWSATAWRSAIESVLMIVTVQDPPRLDWRSLLVVAGVVASLLGLLRAPVARRLPLGLALVCVAAVAGGLVARGAAYPGRFSIHLIPAAVAMAVLAGSSLAGLAEWRHAS